MSGGTVGSSFTPDVPVEQLDAAAFSYLIERNRPPKPAPPVRHRVVAPRASKTK